MHLHFWWIHVHSSLMVHCGPTITRFHCLLHPCALLYSASMSCTFVPQSYHISTLWFTVLYFSNVLLTSYTLLPVVRLHCLVHSVSFPCSAPSSCSAPSYSAYDAPTQYGASMCTSPLIAHCGPSSCILLVPPDHISTV